MLLKRLAASSACTCLLFSVAWSSAQSIPMEQGHRPVIIFSSFGLDQTAIDALEPSESNSHEIIVHGSRFEIIESNEAVILIDDHLTGRDVNDAMEAFLVKAEGNLSQSDDRRGIDDWVFEGDGPLKGLSSFSVVNSGSMQLILKPVMQLSVEGSNSLVEIEGTAHPDYKKSPPRTPTQDKPQGGEEKNIESFQTNMKSEKRLPTSEKSRLLKFALDQLAAETSQQAIKRAKNDQALNMLAMHVFDKLYGLNNDSVGKRLSDLKGLFGDDFARLVRARDGADLSKSNGVIQGVNFTWTVELDIAHETEDGTLNVTSYVSHLTPMKPDQAVPPTR